MHWMQQVERKVDDYHVDGYERLLADAIARLPAVVDSKEFVAQMSRFIDSETLGRTMRDPRFGDYLKATVGQVLQAMAAHLGRTGAGPVADFKM